MNGLEFDINEGNRSDARAAKDALQSKAQEALSSGEKYVRDNPIPTLIAALLIGAVIAILFTQREKRRKDPIELLQAWLEAALDNVTQKVRQARDAMPEPPPVGKTLDHALKDLRKKLHLD